MNYRMDLSYDGTKYNGWQRQRHTSNTIQGKIEEALTKYFEVSIKITGASRTDAGAHAKMQVINFKTQKEIDIDTLRQDMNRYLPSSIVVNDIQIVDDRFHSRFNAVKKMYTYYIWKSNAKYPPLFNRKYVYCYDRPIDIDMLKVVSQKFVGEHDFKGFSSDKTKKGTVRNIEKVRVSEDDFKIKIQITGNGFLYNMIRIIVGTMLEVNIREMKTETIDEIFETHNRELAGFTVPACGLFLEKIYY